MAEILLLLYLGLVGLGIYCLILCYYLGPFGPVAIIACLTNISHAISRKKAILEI